MTHAEHHHPAPSEPKPLWYRLVRGLAVFTVRSIGVLVIIAALFVLFAQTELFQKWIREGGITFLNEQLQGKVVVDDVRLDVFRGFVIDHPRLYAGGTTVLDAERLTVNYDPSALFVRVAAITNLALEKPKIQIVRTADSVWNIERIALPSSDTTQSEPPMGTLVVRRLQIVGGSLLVDDRTVPWPEQVTRFDPTHLNLADLELNLAARLNLREHDASVAINGLSCKDVGGGPLTVHGLSAIVRCSPAGIDVQSLRLRMPNTVLEARMTMDSVDVFSGFGDEQLHMHPMRGHVRADRVWGPDVHFFVPEVDVVGDYAIEADVEFSGNAIRISDLDLSGGSSSVHGSVYVNELEGRKPIEIDVTVTQTTGNYAEIRQRLRFVPLPHLPFLEKTTLDTCIVRGKPDDSLWIEVHGSDRPGRVDGTLYLLTRDPLLGYSANLRFSNGDLSVFADSTVATSLNGSLAIQGRGVLLPDLHAEATLQLEQSVLMGRPIRKLFAHVRSDGLGTVRIDSLEADLTQVGTDTTADEYEESESAQTMRLNCELNVADPARPVYSFHVATSSLDLARILRMESLPGRLSMDLHGYVEGFELDSIRGTVGGRVSELALSDRAMMPFDLDASITRQDRTRALRLKTDFAKVDVEGEFIPSHFLEALAASVQTVVGFTEDAVRHAGVQPAGITPRAAVAEPMNVRLKLDVDDASPLNMALPNATVSGAAVMRAHLTSTANVITFVVDTLATNNISVSGEGVDVDIQPAKLTCALTIDDLTTRPKLVKLDVRGAVDSLITVGSLRIHAPSLTVHHDGSTMRFNGRTSVNDVIVHAAGSYTPTSDAAAIVIDSALFVLDTANDLEWRLLRAASATLSGGVLHIEDLAFQRPWSETVTVRGIVSAKRFRGLRVAVENFPLSDLPKFIAFEPTHPARLIGGLAQEAVVTIDGEWEAPEITTKLKISQLSYNRALIGNWSSTLAYRDQNVTGTATVVDHSGSDSTQTMLLRVGAVPINLSLADVQERIRKDKPWDVELVANSLSLTVVEPFLPAIERVRGLANASIAVKGTSIDDIKLSGQARYWDGSFLSSSTNITYVSSGVVTLDGQVLSLDSVFVQNRSSDWGGGAAFASGKVVFDGLTVDNIDFTVTTPSNRGIMVMNQSSQARSPNVYGDLVIGAGKNPIRMYGKIDAPRLVGDIHVLYSDLTFPKERSTTKAQASHFERVRAAKPDRDVSLADYVLKGVVADTNTPDSSNRDPMLASTNAIKQTVRASTASFADIIDYDLKIFLRGRTLMTMILGPFEILVADLEQVDLTQPLVFTGKFGNNSTNLRGVIRLKEGASTYKFYKPFKTSGLLNFTAGGMTNPGLDLVAVYQDRRFVSENKSEEYKVELKITGTKEKPRIAYRVWRNDVEMVGDSAKIASDALMLILVGRTSDDLVQAGQGDLVGQVNAAFSAVATNALSDVVSDLGFVQNAQIDIGSDISQSRLTVSGQLFGDVSYRVSGQFSDFSGNNTFTITVPLSVLADASLLRQFQADISHTVNNSGNITRQTRLWEIRLGWRMQ